MITSASLDRSRLNGFTLIELLVVMGLLSVVTALGMSVFVSVDAAWDVRRAEEEMEAIAVFVFENVERDMSDVLSAEVSGYSLHGVSNEYKIPNSILNAYIPQDEVIFPVQGTQTGGSMLYGRNVRYSVDRTPENTRLVRHEGPINQANPNRGAIYLTPLRADVNGFRIEYAVHGSDEWTNEWSRDELPAAVRVSLSLQYGSRPDVQIARKRVFPIHVR